jgi:thiol-disulfide isomerase/thioredoxin
LADVVGELVMGWAFDMMRKMMLAVLYTAFACGANAGSLDGLLVDDMKKLALVEPVAIPEAVLLDGAEAEHTLAEYQGKWVVLNFWATWCAPCRAEMPSLDRLQVAMPDIAVVPVATGRNAVAQIEKFYTEAGVVNLPVLRDPKSELARGMGVLGLPVTVILDPQGREVARLIGDAEWDSPAALTVLKAIQTP